MKLTIHERLAKFIDYTKLSKVDFGKKFNASRFEVNNWCNGTKMNISRLSEMLKAYPQLNSDWFITGIGRMVNDGVEPEISVCESEMCVGEKIKLRNKTDDLYLQIQELQKENKELNARVINLQQEQIKLLSQRL